MKEIQGYPPNIEKIRAAFSIAPRTVFTYGDTLYNPSGGYIDAPLSAHEATHTKQQLTMGIDEWWDKYIADPLFRVEQEVEAYRVQYRAAASIDADRNKLLRYARALASDLSSPLYGDCISFEAALTRITSKEDVSSNDGSTLHQETQ